MVIDDPPLLLRQSPGTNSQIVDFVDAQEIDFVTIDVTPPMSPGNVSHTLLVFLAHRFGSEIAEAQELPILLYLA